MIQSPYDALILVSFGGPEGPGDVIPFLENVLRGRNVPRERLLEVAGHYNHFGGKSPINDQNRDLVIAIRELLREQGPDLPVYWGNRNWHPFLETTIRAMRDDGIKRALAFVTSPFSSYSGCRQYRENVEAARELVGPGAPEILKLRAYYNHPGFLRPMAANVRRAIEQLDGQAEQSPHVAFTAHSIPVSMAQTSEYELQLRAACALVAADAGVASYELVFQSRSGQPSQPWLEPDIGDHLRALRANDVTQVVVAPIGFVSDHMEVLYDLDFEAAAAAKELGMNMVRASTVGVHPEFTGMIRDLILERIDPLRPKLFLGTAGPSHDLCAPGCCPPPVRQRPT